jgi:hypothetical protein
MLIRLLSNHKIKENKIRFSMKIKKVNKKTNSIRKWISQTIISKENRILLKKISIMLLLVIFPISICWKINQSRNNIKEKKLGKKKGNQKINS